MINDFHVNIKNSQVYREIAEEVTLEVTQKVTQKITMQLTLQMIQKVAEAKREMQREIAVRMLQKKMAPALISELTNVAKLEVLEMRRESANGPKQNKSPKSEK